MNDIHKKFENPVRLQELNEAGFKEVETFDLGDNFYCMIIRVGSAEEKG